MSLIRENPPIMTLAEETLDRVTFQFKGQGWAVAILIPGVFLVAVVLGLYAAGNNSFVALSLVGLLGVLLIYSNIYSLTSSQWLSADSRSRTIKFYKKNLYGLVDWERSADEFKRITVGKYRRSTNWTITIVCNDGLRLEIGENVFWSINYEGALAIDNKVSSRIGIPVGAHNNRN